MKSRFLGTLWLLLLLPPLGAPGWAVAQTVSVLRGNVVFTDAAGRTIPLTDSGRDSAPDLAPDGRRVAFVRATPGQTVETGSGEEEATEIWMVGVDGKNPTLLVRGKGDAKEMRNVLAALQTPQFSPDGKQVYFGSAAWATSGAIHAVDLRTRRVRFVMPGNGLEVVRTGEYRGCLLVQQHRYFLGGGSFDWFWLFRADGKEVGPVGEDTANFKELYGK